MVHEQVAGANRCELISIIEERERRPRDGEPVVDLQVGPVELRQLRRIREVERAVDRVDVIVGNAEPLLNALAQRGRHLGSTPRRA